MRRRPPNQRPRPSLRGALYQRGFLRTGERTEILKYLSTLRPIWENRFSAHNPPPQGEEQRLLLRPVYWLGNWQFACLDYYHPPKGILHRCVGAEPYPPVLQRIVARIEARAREVYHGTDIPEGWRLNTCLINFYGSRITAEGKRVDTARVGEHRDYEPGPVGSLSLGDRALFQFVASRGRGTREGVVLQEWLEDGSFQLFGGAYFKDKLFHRVQRVEKKRGEIFPPAIPGFESRRVNFTFRYVPEKHIVPYRELPAEKASDVRGYMEQLAQHSPFFKEQLT